MKRKTNDLRPGERVGNPYRPQADGPTQAASVKGAVRSCASLIAYIAAMAVLTIGMLWMLWKVSGR
ncbi:hypothetical protein [Enorma burkinafasonensis]|uniref:hypothetical protein n=1 Tax=Enorma burkinafasonensis TaxID=2590867 RepID=UPI00119C973D|nr:hypothetical protein [Enorma burkinafasonensis]